MKKIFESDFYHYPDERTMHVEKVHVFQIESEEEHWEVSGMAHEQLCNYFEVRDQLWTDVPCGAEYRYYSFNTEGCYVIMREVCAMNL